MSKTMYPGKDGSPYTTLTADIGTTDYELQVADSSVLPDPNNILVIYSVDENGNITKWERCPYDYIDGNSVFIGRGGWGFDEQISSSGEGVSLPFSTGDRVARMFTNWDYEALRENAALWTEITGYNHTRASSSTITMIEDLTDMIVPGMCIKWRDSSGIEYVASVREITSSLMTIAGVELHPSSIEKLYYGKRDWVKQLTFVIPGQYADSSETGLLSADLSMTGGYIHRGPPMYLVEATIRHGSDDSGGSQPTVNLTINSTDVFSSNLVVGTTESSSGVEIGEYHEFNDSLISRGDALEISVVAGSNGDAEDLIIDVVTVIVPEKLDEGIPE